MSNQEEVCPVCLETPRLATLPCNHKICVECLVKWRNSKTESTADCPICRDNFRNPRSPPSLESSSASREVVNVVPSPPVREIVITGNSLVILRNTRMPESIMRWISSTGLHSGKEMCDVAAFENRIDVLECLSRTNPRFLDRQTCICAAEGGHLDVFQWLRAQNPPCPWDEMVCVSAVKHGHFDILRWLRAQDPPCPWNEWVCDVAASEGRLDILQWIRSQDPPCPWDELTCMRAAEGGHLNVLQWARAQNPPCPWDEQTCTSAATGGYLNVLQWARAQNPPCPWSEETCTRAFGRDRLLVLRWLRSQDPPCPCSEQIRIEYEGIIQNEKTINHPKSSCRIM